MIGTWHCIRDQSYTTSARLQTPAASITTHRNVIISIPRAFLRSGERGFVLEGVLPSSGYSPVSGSFSGRLQPALRSRCIIANIVARRELISIEDGELYAERSLVLRTWKSSFSSYIGLSECRMIHIRKTLPETAARGFISHILHVTFKYDQVGMR
jgi:hypothetical protein